MAIPMLVFWALAICGVVALVRGTAQDAGQASSGPGPEHVLVNRNARGGIDADEYQERLATLRNTTRTAA